MRALERIRRNFKRYLVVVILGMLAYAIYAVAWHTWRGHVSNTLGFFFIAGSLPWSGAWLGVMFDPPFIGMAGHKYITLGAVALGFGINCGLLALVFDFVLALLKRSPSARSDAISKS